MPEIGLLEPRVLNGVINEFDAPEDFLGHQLVGTPDRDINPSWEYDVELPVRGAQTTFNTPNAEARIVDHTPISHKTGGYAYVRDKKIFSPTTLRWLRAAGENTVNRRNAERYVLKEVRALRLQHLRGEEIAIWEMLKGRWQYSTTTGATIDINYFEGLPATFSSMYNPQAATLWNAANAKPIADIGTWKRQISRATGYAIQYAYLNSVTMARFLALDEVTEFLSDRQKDRFTSERVLPRFMGIDWYEYDGGYALDDVAGTYTPYIPDGYIIFIAPGGDDIFNMLYGPSADHDAPLGHTGPFTKSWLEPDPSARQFLIENNFMPVLRKPRQRMYARAF